MTRNKIMRVITILTALAMLFVVAGCNPSSTTEGTEPAGTTAPGQTSQGTDEVVTLTMFYSSPEMYPGWNFGDDPISQSFVEEFGVSVDISYASNTDNQELYTMLSSGQKLPDLLYVSKYDPMFVEEEFVLPLNQLADEHYPEFWDLLPYQYEDVHTLADGNIYYMNNMFADTEALEGLPGGSKGVSGMAVNNDLLEQMDNPAIDTLAGVKEAALQAKEMGVSYPIFLTHYAPTHNLHYAQTLNVCFGGPGFVYPQDDGTVTFNCKAEEYKKGMAYLNDLYRSGLIQADNFTFNMGSTDENVKQIATSGDAFALFSQEWVMRQFRSNLGVGGSSDAYLFRMQDLPIGDGVSRDDVKMDDFNASNIGNAGGWFITADTEYPAESIKFLSNLASEKWQLLFFHGEEGVQYDVYTFDGGDPAGYKVSTPDYSEDAGKLTTAELIIKYGAMNSVLATLRTRNVQIYFDRPFYGPKEVDGQMVMLGDGMVDLGLKYGTPFKTGALTVNITDTDGRLLYDNVIKAWQDNEPNLVLAEDDAAFEAAYTKMISDMEKVGLADLETILTERYNQYDAALNETRND